jgi:hypothetical protein
MTVKHAGKEYTVLCFTYPRHGNLYYDPQVNRVKMAGRNIDSRKYIIVTRRERQCLSTGA